VADPNIPRPILPAHIEETVKSIARLHADHHQNATPLERAVDRMTALLGRPRFVGVLTVIVLGWIMVNVCVAALGHRPVDPPPFSWLADAASIASLYVAVLILTTQRRADQLAQRREQLTLELAILSEQKMAKLIELIEEFRRDSPLVVNRIDEQADAMSKPADPQSVLGAIKLSHTEAEQTDNAAGFREAR
jgi:uncharacterized membrane protein